MLYCNKKKSSTISIITLNTLPIGVAGFLLFITGLIFENPSLMQISSESIFALFYLGTVASTGGFITYFYLLKRLNPVVLSFVFIIFQVISVIIGSRFDEKLLSSNFYIWFCFLLFGFALTKTTPKQLEQLYRYLQAKIFSMKN